MPMPIQAPTPTSALPKPNSDHSFNLHPNRDVNLAMPELGPVPNAEPYSDSNLQISNAEIGAAPLLIV